MRRQSEESNVARINSEVDVIFSPLTEASNQNEEPATDVKLSPYMLRCVIERILIINAVLDSSDILLNSGGSIYRTINCWLIIHPGVFNLVQMCTFRRRMFVI